jgi:hypothetical protein
MDRASGLPVARMAAVAAALAMPVEASTSAVRSQPSAALTLPGQISISAVRSQSSAALTLPGQTSTSAVRSQPSAALTLPGQTGISAVQSQPSLIGAALGDPRGLGAPGTATIGGTTIHHHHYGAQTITVSGTDMDARSLARELDRLRRAEARRDMNDGDAR